MFCGVYVRVLVQARCCWLSVVKAVSLQRFLEGCDDGLSGSGGGQQLIPPENVWRVTLSPRCEETRRRRSLTDLS